MSDDDWVTRCIWEPITFVARWHRVRRADLDNPNSFYTPSHASATMTVDEFHIADLRGLVALRYGKAERKAAVAEAARWGVSEIVWSQHEPGSPLARVMRVDVETGKLTVRRAPLRLVFDPMPDWARLPDEQECDSVRHVQPQEAKMASTAIIKLVYPHAEDHGKVEALCADHGYQADILAGAEAAAKKHGAKHGLSLTGPVTGKLLDLSHS